VTGTVVKACVHNGTYYSETLAEGFDPAGPQRLAGLHRRGRDPRDDLHPGRHPRIGLCASCRWGWRRVSTCDIRVYEGQRVEKGDELGMFHFGGSTHCLIFRRV